MSVTTGVHTKGSQVRHVHPDELRCRVLAMPRTSHPSDFPPELVVVMQAWVEKLHGRGQRWVPIVDPGIKVEPGEAAYDDGIAKDVFLKDVTGQPYIGQVRPLFHLPTSCFARCKPWCELFLGERGFRVGRRLSCSHPLAVMTADTGSEYPFQTDRISAREVLLITHAVLSVACVDGLPRRARSVGRLMGWCVHMPGMAWRDALPRLYAPGCTAVVAAPFEGVARPAAVRRPVD